VCSSDLTNLKNLPINERIQLVEDLWDSIASEQKEITITKEQSKELDNRLAAYAIDKNKGRLATTLIENIRKRI